VFAGSTASSVLFTGADGRYYKTGYAPIRDDTDDKDDKNVVAALGVQGNAAFFRDLEQLQAYLLAAGGVIAALVVLISVLVARRITRPLRALAQEAVRIGEGDLERPIEATSRDEVGLLAGTMNDMRSSLYARDQELQMMLSGIAHEVRNPLGGIALFAGLLRDELAGNADHLEMVERIERELGYLKNVVGEFLDYARRTPLEQQPLELGDLLDDVSQVLSADAAAAKITLVVEREPAAAMGDAEHLRRVLLNLARNAVQAAPAGSRVWLRSGAGEGGPFMEVEDEGAGISEELRDRVFAPFFTTREKGTGLGLALSKKIVEEHGGGIELATGHAGTRFRVILRPVTDT
jgi:signal transduction histidine kinase